MEVGSTALLSHCLRVVLGGAGQWRWHFGDWAGRQEVASLRCRDEQTSVPNSGSGTVGLRVISHQLPLQFFDEINYDFSVLRKVRGKLNCKTSPPTSRLWRIWPQHPRAHGRAPDAPASRPRPRPLARPLGPALAGRWKLPTQLCELRPQVLGPRPWAVRGSLGSLGPLLSLGAPPRGAEPPPSTPGARAACPARGSDPLATTSSRERARRCGCVRERARPRRFCRCCSRALCRYPRRSCRRRRSRSAAPAEERVGRLPRSAAQGRAEPRSRRAGGRADR